VGKAEGISNSQKIVPSKNDYTWSGLPTRDFIDKVKKQNGKLLIDLSTEKEYFNACVAACSGIPIRISNFGTWGPPIYNFEVKTNYLRNPELILKSLVEVLKSFRTGTYN
jgi:hypothetical protein